MIYATMAWFSLKSVCGLESGRARCAASCAVDSGSDITSMCLMCSTVTQVNNKIQAKHSTWHMGPAHSRLPYCHSYPPRCPPPSTEPKRHCWSQGYLFESHFGPLHSREAATNVQDVHLMAQLSAHFKHKPGICDGLSIGLRVRTATANVKTGKGGRASAHMLGPTCYHLSTLDRHNGHGAHLTDVMTEGLRG